MTGGKGYDGERPWGANDDPGALLELPAWASWRGERGFRNDKSHVKSPGQRPCFNARFDAVCTEMASDDSENCPGASAQGSSSSSARASQAEPTRDPCAAWNGPGIVATVCDPARLVKAMASGTLGVKPGPTVKASGSLRGTYPSSGGLAQIPGSALQPGEQVARDASLSAGSELLVRAKEGGNDRRMRFAARDLPDRRSRLRLTRGSRGALQLVRPDGERVHPVRVGAP